MWPSSAGSHSACEGRRPQIRGRARGRWTASLSGGGSGLGRIHRGVAIDGPEPWTCRALDLETEPQMPTIRGAGPGVGSEVDQRGEAVRPVLKARPQWGRRLVEPFPSSSIVKERSPFSSTRRTTISFASASFAAFCKRLERAEVHRRLDFLRIAIDAEVLDPNRERRPSRLRFDGTRQPLVCEERRVDTARVGGPSSGRPMRPRRPQDDRGR